MARKKTVSKSKKSTKKKSAKAQPNYAQVAWQFMRSPEGRKVFGMLVILFSVIMLIACISHFWTGNMDQSSLAGGNDRPRNWLGAIGAGISDLLVRKGFGIPALLIPLYTGLLGFAILEKNYYRFLWKALKYVLFVVLWGATTLFFLSAVFGGRGLIGGGFGLTINTYLGDMLGMVGTGLVIVFTLLIFLVLNFNTEFPVSRWLGRLKPEIEEGEEEGDAKEGKTDTKAEKEGKKKTEEEETEEKGEDDFILSVRKVEEEQQKVEVKEEKQPEVKEEVEKVQTIPIEIAGMEETKPEPVEKKEEPVSLGPELTIEEPVVEEGSFQLDPTLPDPSQIPEIGQSGGLELQIEDTRKDEPVLPTIEGDNIQQVGQDKFEKIVPESDQEDLKLDGELADWENYDPTLELSDYQYPGMDLLEHRDGSKNREVNRQELEENKNKIVQTLQHYKIDIQSIKATIGPTVTLYEIVPAPGVRISKIRNLEDDIALSLAALGIRIIAPIPGKGTIGIEIPNSKQEIVGMRSVLSTEKYRDTKAALPLVLGRTISNEVYIADLAKMPHLLIAGATGQGKSVGINGIISSLLFKKHPAQVKFVLIDPKKVELNLYDELLSHFLAKLEYFDDAIITDTKQVISVLNSLCLEMDNRYDLLKKAKTRNLSEYNEKFKNRRLNPKKGHRFMPYIVLIIDEFADLMMTAGKEIETPIARLAQLARAVGIHLILATQRPSVNVITGIIKANFPARISFRVTSKVDSRTILDTGGADQLIGKGDMLLSTGSELVRIQNPFIDTPEVDQLVDFIAQQRGYPQPYLLPEVPMEGDDNGPSDDVLDDRDDMFDDAARLIVKHQQGSTSLIQRRLKLGYNRAGRIIDQLERAGIVGPFSGSKAREVLVNDEYALEQLLRDLDG